MSSPGRRASVIEKGRRRLVAWIRGLVTDVRAGEGTTALLMALNGFLVLMAYSCIKPVREALILARPDGAEYKVYMAGATALVLLGAVPAYARVSRHLPRNGLVVGVTLFFVAHLAGFYALALALGSTLPLALGFYLWIAVFNMMIVAQFWAFANYLYSDEAGQRLFPLLGVGTSVGALAGAAVAKTLIVRVGALQMMPVAAVMLLASAGVSQWVHTREVGRAKGGQASEAATRAIGGSAADAVRIVMGQRYLVLIAMFSLLFTMVKTNGDYLLARIVEDGAKTAVAAGAIRPNGVQDYIGGVFANYSFWVDSISLVIQVFVVSRVVKHLGLGFAFFVLPLMAMTDGLITAAWPVLAAVVAGKTAESAVDYSFNNTVRNMLRLPTSRRARNLAKQATDAFFVRAGDVASAGTRVLRGRSVRDARAGNRVCNVMLVTAWLLLARSIVAERARLERGEHNAVEAGGAAQMTTLVGGIAMFSALARSLAPSHAQKSNVS